MIYKFLDKTQVSIPFKHILKKKNKPKKELKVTLFYLGNSDLRSFDYLFKNLKFLPNETHSLSGFFIANRFA